MVTYKGLVGPNTKIIIGIGYLIFATIYIADNLMNSLEIRLFDWIGWIALFTAGAASIIEGIRIKIKNKQTLRAE